MSSFRFTLVADGPSDRALMPILKKLCSDNILSPIRGEWFDPRPLAPPRMGLKDRLARGVQLFPCDLLFVHRDAETKTIAQRREEIKLAIDDIGEEVHRIPYVCIIPVRMTEAWLILDETAIRLAAGNPNGTMSLFLPPINRVEKTPDPKKVLIEALKTASGLPPRRQKKLDISHLRVRVAELITNYELLQRLSAFREVERSVRQFASQWKA